MFASLTPPVEIVPAVTERSRATPSAISAIAITCAVAGFLGRL